MIVQDHVTLGGAGSSVQLTFTVVCLVVVTTNWAVYGGTGGAQTLHYTTRPLVALSQGVAV